MVTQARVLRGGYRRRTEVEPAHWPGFHLFLVGRACSKATVQGYLKSYRIWDEWCQEAGIDALLASHEDIARWFLERQDRAPSTLRNNLIALRSLFRYAVSCGLRADDPTLGMRMPTVSLPPIHPYTAEDIRAFFRAARSDRDRAMLYLFLSSGLRLSELANLTASDIDWTEGTISILGKGGKYRVIALDDVIMDALRLYWQRPSGPFWASITRPDGVRIWFTRLAKRAGVKGAHVHRFRHTFAHDWLYAGGGEGDLQILLGHSTLFMSLHYAADGRQRIALQRQRQLLPALRRLQGLAPVQVASC